MTIRPARLARSRRPGATLIEVIVALTLLAMSGLVGLELTRAAGFAVEVAAESEKSSAAANDFLNAVSQWSRSELDQRLGEREQGPWRLEIMRATPTLYMVSLRDSAGAHVVLATALFRMEALRETP